METMANNQSSTAVETPKFHAFIALFQLRGKPDRPKRSTICRI